MPNYIKENLFLFDGFSKQDLTVFLIQNNQWSEQFAQYFALNSEKFTRSQLIQLMF